MAHRPFARLACLRQVENARGELLSEGIGRPAIRMRFVSPAVASFMSTRNGTRTMTIFSLARNITVLAALAGLSGLAAAGTIYGVILENGRPVSAPLTLKCGARQATTTPDQRGSYNLNVDAIGRCNLQVAGGTAEITVYDNPTRYNFELVGQGANRRLVQR